MSIFTGSSVAIVTPFQDGKVNYPLLQKLLEFQLQNHTDAITICGTTGESSTLTDDEQIECIRFTVEQVNKRVPVIAGTGSNDTDHGIELTKRAYAAGADAALLVTPYYNKTTQKGLIEHYTLMAQAVDIPIILYNVPGRTGLNLAPKTVAELSKIDTIVALKEASGNISQIAEIAALCGDRLDLYSGNDDQILPLLSLGAKGVISVVANVAPKETHDVVQKFFDGDFAGSLSLQLDLLPLIQALFIEVSPIPVKAALELMGYPVGVGRRPLTTMEPANLEILKKTLTNFGLNKL